ncbi:DUF727 domain-containing protein [Meloidogyne graminicola]|uniref:DUF727 domain-containing protein n=1 Tax=Meloidogyne graminicola TaxID=189291 RepID=A0A8S9ZZ27_9BILA|nr:DUF727 domain-containing protein [Meloidogyne graminicola]
MSAISSTSSLSFPSSNFPLSFNGNSRLRQSCGECNISPLELEAFIVIQQFADTVESIAVSEMLPRTSELIFINLTTLEGQPHCLELTNKGWRITSLRTDCMHGDFTKIEIFTNYYNSFNELMDYISPGYQKYLKNNKLNFFNSTECSSNNSINNSEEFNISNNNNNNILYSSLKAKH